MNSPLLERLYVAGKCGQDTMHHSCRFNPLDSWEVIGAQGVLEWASRTVVGRKFATARTIQLSGPTPPGFVERLTSWAVCYEQQSTLLDTIDSLGEDVVTSTQANAISGTSTSSNA